MKFFVYYPKGKTDMSRHTYDHEPPQTAIPDSVLSSMTSALEKYDRHNVPDNGLVNAGGDQVYNSPRGTAVQIFASAGLPTSEIAHNMNELFGRPIPRATISDYLSNSAPVKVSRQETIKACERAIEELRSRAVGLASKALDALEGVMESEAASHRDRTQAASVVLKQVPIVPKQNINPVDDALRINEVIEKAKAAAKRVVYVEDATIKDQHNEI